MLVVLWLERQILSSQMSSCAGGEQRAYDGSALQRKALSAEETRARNREQAKRSAEKKKEAHAAALEEADGLRTDNASLRKLRPPSLS